MATKLNDYVKEKLGEDVPETSITLTIGMLNGQFLTSAFTLNDLNEGGRKHLDAVIEQAKLARDIKSGEFDAKLKSLKETIGFDK